MRRLKTLLTILLSLGVGFGAGWFWTAGHLGVGDARRLSQLEQENRDLKSTVDGLRSSGSTHPDAPDREQHSRITRPPGKSSKSDKVHSDDSEAVRALRANLDAANQFIGELQARATDLQTQLDKAGEEQKRLAALEADLTARLALAKEEIAAKGTELSRKNEQFSTLEAATNKLREEAAAATQKISDMSRATSELQDLYRRRESYLSSLIGRYREVTEQYRAFASVLENRRGPEGTPGAGISIAGPELARIQNTITLAEEDLRQLNALNAQAVRVQKKLSGK
jgi:chromosome segregation ATPase